MFMTKTIRLALMLLLCVGVLSGCASEDAGPEIITGSVTMDKPSEPGTAAQPNDTEPVEAAESSAFYIEYGNRYLPVSLIVEGKQIFTGELWYDEADDIVVETGGPTSDDLPKHSISDMYKAGSGRPSDGVIGLMVGRVAANAEWNLFPIQISYTRYSLENQPEDTAWVEYFTQAIGALSDSTPLIFTEAWRFDWNGDGVEDALVNVSNTLISYDDIEPKPPHADDTVIYTLSALFVSGLEPIAIMNSISSIEKDPLDDEKGIHVSYTISDVSPEWAEHYVSSIQYDEEGEFIQSPIFNSGEFGRAGEPGMLLCDIDGDGYCELLIVPSGIYAPVVVYKLVDGVLHEELRIYTPA